VKWWAGDCPGAATAGAAGGFVVTAGGLGGVASAAVALWAVPLAAGAAAAGWAEAAVCPCDIWGSLTTDAASSSEGDGIASANSALMPNRVTIAPAAWSPIYLVKSMRANRAFWAAAITSLRFWFTWLS
jgi:hypothetical protein